MLHRSNNVRLLWATSGFAVVAITNDDPAVTGRLWDYFLVYPTLQGAWALCPLYNVRKVPVMLQAYRGSAVQGDQPVYEDTNAYSPEAY